MQRFALLPWLGLWPKGNGNGHRSAQSITLEKLVEKWQELVGRTLKSWPVVRCISNQLARLWGDRELHEITAQTVLAWRAGELARGSGPRGINHKISILKRVFNCAIDWGYLERNPLGCVRRLRETPRSWALRPEEFKRLLDACRRDKWMRALVLLAAHTGRRKTELLRLRWSDLNLARREMRAFDSKANRWMGQPLTRSAARALEILRRRRFPILPMPDDYVFSTSNRLRKGEAVRDIQSRWRRLRRRAQLEGLHFHDLRHTFASWLIERGVDPATVMSLTGHSSPGVFLRYCNLSSKAKKKAIRRLESAF